MYLILTLLLAIVIYLFNKYYNKVNELAEWGVLHKKPWPIFGNMGPLLFRRSTFTDMIDEAYHLKEDAKYVGFYDFDAPVLIIKSPELIKEISIKQFDHFVDHRNVVEPELDPLFGNNLFSLRGDRWREIRNLLSPAFTSSKMKSMFQLMGTCGESFVDHMVEKASKKSYVVNSKEIFKRYTTDVIATCAFGISIDSLNNPDNEFYKLANEALDFENQLSLKFFLLRSFPFLAKFFNIRLIDAKVEKFFKNIVAETIETRKLRGITRPDMINLMMESQKERNLSLTEMTSQAFVFFLGGFDTTSTLMCFVAHHIAQYPEVQKRLREEIETVLSSSGGELTYEAINKMEYLDAIISETQRLFPIAFILDRVCVKSYELPPAFEGAKPVKVEPGHSVWFPNWCLHRDPKYFSDPDVFRPERFLSDEKNNIDPSTYMPFGIGPRVCIGNRFALLEVKVILIHLVARCDLKPGPKTIVPLKMRKIFAMAVEGGFWLELRARKDPILCTSKKVNGVRVESNGSI